MPEPIMAELSSKAVEIEDAGRVKKRTITDYYNYITKDSDRWNLISQKFYQTHCMKK